MTVVDFIFKEYATSSAVPNLQPLLVHQLLIKTMTYIEFYTYMMKEYFKIVSHDAIGLNRREKVKLIRNTFKERASLEQVLT
jgi:hypothetical protein